jgi:hypothetical protein
MRKYRLLLISLVAAWLAAAQSGCMLLAAGALGGGVAAVGIKRGTVSRTFSASVEETTTALQAALTDLGLPVERPRLGKKLAEIDSTLDDGSPVFLTVRAEPKDLPNDPPQSRVEVHIRVFGDRPRSERILDRVEYRLKNPAPLPVAPPISTPTILPPAASDRPVTQTDEPALAPSKSP